MIEWVARYVLLWLNQSMDGLVGEWTVEISYTESCKDRLKNRRSYQKHVYICDGSNGSFFFLRRCDPILVMASSFLRFLDHTQRRSKVDRTPLDEWSVRRRDLYLTTHNTHNRQTSMPPVGFEPTISAGERPQTYALDRSATETGINGSMVTLIH